MGMRYLQMNTTYTGNTDGSAVFHVAQISANPSLLVPGPAMLFVTVNGIPSVGQFLMVGNGIVGTQPLAANSPALVKSSGNFKALSSSQSSVQGAAAGASTTSAGTAATTGSVKAAGVGRVGVEFVVLALAGVVGAVLLV